MTRFIARLFATRTPTASNPAARHPPLGEESLETRETPSSISHALKHVTHLHHNYGGSVHLTHHAVDLPTVANLLHRRPNRRRAACRPALPGSLKYSQLPTADSRCLPPSGSPPPTSGSRRVPQHDRRILMRALTLAAATLFAVAGRAEEPKLPANAVAPATAHASAVSNDGKVTVTLKLLVVTAATAYRTVNEQITRTVDGKTVVETVTRKVP